MAKFARIEPARLVRAPTCMESGCARYAALRLRDAIAAKAPHLHFSLLYLTATEAADWGEDGIVNVFLRQPEPYVWTGDDAAWEQVFQKVSKQPGCRGPQQ